MSETRAVAAESRLAGPAECRATESYQSRLVAILAFGLSYE
jgi:hypothetical protein